MHPGFPIVRDRVFARQERAADLPSGEVLAMNLLLFLLVALTSTSAMADPFPTGPHVYVEGSAEVRVEPDTVHLWVAIAATDPQLATAKASVDDRARKLIESCKKLGIKGVDI